MLLPDSELIVQVDKDTLFRLLYNNLIYDCLSFEEAAEIYGLTLNKFKVEYMKAAFDNFVIDFYNIFPLDVFEEEMTFLLSYYSTDEDTNTALNEILPEFYDAMIMGDLDAFYQKHSFIYEVEDETEISDN